jgi:hypothetical protein
MENLFKNRTYTCHFNNVEEVVILAEILFLLTTTMQNILHLLRIKNALVLF